MTPAPAPTASVVGRFVYYLGSSFDVGGRGSAHENAIAPDKTPLLTLQDATFANYTSYSRGLNGIMVDIAGGTGGGVGGLGMGLSAADFAFKVGNSADVSEWATAPAPESIIERPGSGVGGSDRVEISWADNAIQGQWLQVTVRADAQTTLPADDMFYFGNAIGETGNDPASTRVDAIDQLSVRANNTASAELSNRFDFNRDGVVDGTDEAITRANSTCFLSDLALFTVPVIAPTNAASNLNAVVLTSSQVQLTWKDNSADESGFKVERSTDGVTYAMVATVAANATTYTDTKLTPATQYYYEIVTARPGGDELPSNAASPTTAALILPGAGWTGASAADPAIQSTDPTKAGFDELAIARWDVVPYQTFDKEFNVGVVAFHMNGIKEVDFSVNGGAWVKVTQMTVNPQVGNSSDIGVKSDGVVEYWATLDASKFAADGPIEVRAIAYPTNGKARVLQGATIQANGEESLVLNANAHSTLPSLVRYVGTTGSDTTGDGSQAKPFATMMPAAMSIQKAQGSVDGGTIYLMPGDYPYGMLANTWPLASNSNQYLTITAAPGVRRDQVRLLRPGYSDGMRTKLVHLANVTLAPASAADQAILTSNGPLEDYLWVDNCNLIGPGRTVDSRWASGLSGIYVTDTQVSNCRDGLTGNLVRNTLVTHIGSDAFSESSLVVNCTADNIDSSGTTFHPDVYQFYPSGSNVILYGLTATKSITAQGLFADGTSTLTDVAFVNCVINNQNPNPTVFRVFQFGAPAVNLYVDKCSFVGPAAWRVDFSFTAKDVVVEGTSFSSMPSPMPLDGVTYK